MKSSSQVQDPDNKKTHQRVQQFSSSQNFFQYHHQRVSSGISNKSENTEYMFIHLVLKGKPPFGFSIKGGHDTDRPLYISK